MGQALTNTYCSSLYVTANNFHIHNSNFCRTLLFIYAQATVKFTCFLLSSRRSTPVAAILDVYKM